MLLPDLCGDLRRHFRALGEEERRVAKLWLETEPYYEMIPEGCPQLSRRFFISQVRVALEILLQSPDWKFLAEPVSLPSNNLTHHLSLTGQTKSLHRHSSQRVWNHH